jgi:hypothetical protein
MVFDPVKLVKSTIVQPGKEQTGKPHIIAKIRAIYMGGTGLKQGYSMGDNWKRGLYCISTSEISKAGDSDSRLFVTSEDMNVPKLEA